MPLIIFATAIGIGLWFPVGGNAEGDVERRLRTALTNVCDPAAPPPKIRWALPIVQSTFESAASGWCQRGLDLSTITITHADAGDGGRSITLRGPEGGSIHLLLTIAADGTPLVSSIQFDPAGT